MRRLLTLVVAVFGAAVVGAQERAPRDYVAAALDILEKNSVKRREIEWPTFRADLLKKTESARTIPETYDAIRNAVRALGDHHSSFFEPSVVATMNQRGAALSSSPESHRVQGRIGQLVIPSFGGSDPMFRLSDGAAINLTSAVMADRNGDTFPDGIKPDETAFWESVAEVPKVVTNWLLGQPACRE